MSKCAVLNCRKSRYDANKTHVELIIHSFPQQHELLYRSWVQFCRQGKNWKPSAYFGICSYHFRDEDYQMENISSSENTKQSRILVPNAIPSIFESPAYSMRMKNVSDANLHNTTSLTIEVTDISPRKDVLYHKNRDEFCRTCLTHHKDDTLIPVDSPILNMTVLEMLVQLTAFETTNNILFPTVICVDCKDKLEVAYTIRQQFIEQSELLVQLAAEKKIIDYFNTVSTEALQCTESLLSAEESIHEMYESYSDDGLGEADPENGADQISMDEQHLLDVNGLPMYSERTTQRNDADNKDEPELCAEPENHSTREKMPERKRRKKGSLDCLSLLGEAGLKRKAEILLERSRRYSMVSNRKRYKLEAEAQSRFPLTTCYICDKKHSTLMERDYHMRDHFSMLPYQCKECESFTEVGENESTSNLTKEAPVLLKTINQVNLHFRMHRMPYKCDKCYRRFCTNLKLKTHYWSSHGIAENGLTCEYCGKQYFQRTIFNRHVAYHRNELNGQFKCTMCDRSLGSKSSLHRHESSHKGEKKFKCMYCEKMFSTSYNRLTHQRVAHTGEQPYKCKDCGRAFVDSSKLKIHQESHVKLEPHATNEIRKSSVLPPGKERCPFPDCDFRTVTYRSMYMHKRKQHMREFQCDICSKTFAFKTDLRSHMLLHTGERPFKCEVCDRSFRRVTMYRRHLQTHEPNKRNYNCSICQKGFKMARYLQAHLLTHSTERKFSCDICLGSYKTKGELKRHRQQKHDTEIVDIKETKAEEEEYIIQELLE